MSVDANSPFYHSKIVGKRHKDPKAFQDTNGTYPSSYDEMQSNTALIQFGFPADCWLPARVAVQWRSDYFPAESSPESIRAWEIEISNLIAVADMAERPKFKAIGEKYIDDLNHDLALLKEAGLVALAIAIDEIVEPTPMALKAKADIQNTSMSQTIRYLFGKAYAIDEHEPISVNDSEHAILQEFINIPIMDSATLEKKSNNDRAPRILRELSKKYGGRFASAIKLPGKKGVGGYHVSIVDASELRLKNA